MVENNWIHEEEIVKFGIILIHTQRNSHSTATETGTIIHSSTAKGFMSKNVHILSDHGSEVGEMAWASTLT